ncbi:unnamed protein product, partial [Ectocarpus sp. 13 AM-2016]
RRTPIQVVALCGHLPLVLAIAGSMSVVKGKGLTAAAWEELAKELENMAKKMRARGEQSSSIKVVLETSFDSLAARKQEEFLKMAVLAAGALVPIEMLHNLWEIEDAEGTRDEAEGLVSKCLLHAVGGGGYRVHDLVLEFAKTSIRAEEETVKKATALQAQYLGRLDVLESYRDPEHGAGRQGLFFLDALWRSVEKLSGDPELEVASYRASLGELESCKATEAVARSYSSVGSLFNIQGKYAEAEPLYERSQAIHEKVSGPEHPDVATSLNNRASSLEGQGKYEDTEPLYRRSLAIREKVLGPEHPGVATVLNNRALLLEKQGKYEEAEPLYRRSLAIGEKVYGPDHPEVATVLNNWAFLLQKQVRNKRCFQPVVMGSNAMWLWVWLNSPCRMLPVWLRSGLGASGCRPGIWSPAHAAASPHEFLPLSPVTFQGKFEEAEPLFERSQAIREKVLGPEHPDVATSLNNRAGLLETRGKYEQAEPLYRRSLAIGEKVYGPDHPVVATYLNNWAVLSKKQPLYERSQAIRGCVLNLEHPDVAQEFGKYEEAEPLFERSQVIREKVLGPEHPDVATSLNNRASLLETQSKYEEAEPLYRRSLAINENIYGPDHPKVATDLNNWALLLKKQAFVLPHMHQCHQPIFSLSLPVTFQGKYEEAEPLYRRSLAIREKVLGPEHPDVAQSLNNRAALLETQGVGLEHPDVAKAFGLPHMQQHHQAIFSLPLPFTFYGKYEEAEPLCRRSLAFDENIYGPDHASVATALYNWAVVEHLFLRRKLHLLDNTRTALSFRFQGKYAEADPLYLRAIEIGEKTLGPDHPALATRLNNWAGLLVKQVRTKRCSYDRRTWYVVDLEHPDVAQSFVLSHMHQRHRTIFSLSLPVTFQGKYEEAEPLFKRSLAIDEKVYGPNHPVVASYLNNWALMLQKQVRNKRCFREEIVSCSPGHSAASPADFLSVSVSGAFQGKFEEAEAFYRRSLAIDEKAYGPDHPAVATDLNNRAVLMYAQGKFTEAVSLLERAVSILTKKLGDNHPNTVSAQNRLKVVRAKVRAQLGSL